MPKERFREFQQEIASIIMESEILVEPFFQICGLYNFIPSWDKLGIYMLSLRYWLKVRLFRPDFCIFILLFLPYDPHFIVPIFFLVRFDHFQNSSLYWYNCKAHTYLYTGSIILQPLIKLLLALISIFGHMWFWSLSLISTQWARNLKQNAILWSYADCLKG